MSENKFEKFFYFAAIPILLAVIGLIGNAILMSNQQDISINLIVTPSATPTLSATEIEQTLVARISRLEIEQTATANAILQATDDRATVIALSATPTPTIDTRATAIMQLTRDANETIRQNIRLTTQFTVSGNGMAALDAGLLNALVGQSATVSGTVEVILGVDIETRTFGIIECVIDPTLIIVSIDRRPRSSEDTTGVVRGAFEAFWLSIHNTAINNHWETVRQDLQTQFDQNNVAITVPTTPTATICPPEIEATPTSGTLP